MSIPMTEKELKKLTTKVKRNNLEADLGLESAKVIASLEKRVAKLEKIVHGQELRLQKLWAWKIEKGE